MIAEDFFFVQAPLPKRKRNLGRKRASPPTCTLDEACTPRTQRAVRDQVNLSGRPPFQVPNISAETKANRPTAVVPPPMVFAPLFSLFFCQVFTRHNREKMTQAPVLNRSIGHDRTRSPRFRTESGLAGQTRSRHRQKHRRGQQPEGIFVFSLSTNTGKLRTDPNIMKT